MAIIPHDGRPCAGQFEIIPMVADAEAAVIGPQRERAVIAEDHLYGGDLTGGPLARRLNVKPGQLEIRGKTVVGGRG